MKVNGKENWLGFKHKFLRYAEVRNWTQQEMRDHLCWSLEGKASDYYASTVHREVDIGFNGLMQKLEKRFGGMQLPDTAQEQLANSKQKAEESIEEWADRVMELALRAYPNLPEDYMQTQAIKRICHGCSDKRAGQHVINLGLEAVDVVIDRIKSFQFNHQSIYERHRDQPKREVREVYVSSDTSDGSDSESQAPSPARVRQTRRFGKPTLKEPDKGMEKRMDSLDDRMIRL